ncbi:MULTISPECIES: ParA family protein [Burkholderia cepacia complex]|uniref:ParA family protein n=1 Tax=Burkholderia cepacia complex TaxID=87882 RepID=UPI00075DC189|nr:MULTISPECIES: AAA family ATPase [Burkholderia cepacia complex]KVD61558.1 chromosome partitioning protein [Burkholderia ubonensis]MDN7536329.1 AAA family ATPase [Burkholderia cenocepacia]OJA54112.1 chromosome partitioning protein [Burkholderia ubonensis]QUN53803.1 AAA family ATPase [Burkholderia cenocepacia]SAK07698.1 cobQ/CobB/MinD/ParA nucleotide binding domain protein [Burkholderia multivorans]
MKTISFVNMKGGVGKTTLALNVADCLARTHNKKVAVIDVDPQFNITQCLFSGDEYVDLLKQDADTVLRVFDTDAQPVASAVHGPAASEPKELDEIVLQKKDLLWVLPGNIDLYRLEMTTGEGREFSIQRLIEENLEPEGFDYVIIDTPPTPSMWMTSALIASDYYVIPVKPDPLSLIGIDLLRTIIERRRKSYGLKLKCLGLVFTMVERSDSVVYHSAKINISSNKYWKGYLLDKYLPKRTELAKQQLTQPFILKMEDFELRSSLASIVKKLLENIGEQ